MRSRLAIRVGLALLAIAASPAVECQAIAAPGPGPATILSSGGLGSASALSSLELVREIEDRPLGTRWLLLRDWGHLGGPGRMVLASRAGRPPGGVLANGAPEDPGHISPPAIRAGELVVVERSTAVVEARLESIALEPAAIGASFRARLTIGGKVVHAVALGAGRAAFDQESEGRR
jgi:hypothetical protein